MPTTSSATSALAAPAATTAAVVPVDYTALVRSLFTGKVPESELYRSEFGRGLTLDRIAAAMRDADWGYMRDYTDLASETVAIDPHLCSVLGKRFGSVAAVDWDLSEAQGDDLDPDTAKYVADLVREQLTRIPSFKQSIEDLAWGHFFNRASLEIGWQQCAGRVPWRARSLGWIHPRQLSFGPEREVRISRGIWQGGFYRDVGFDTRELPFKFITFTPRLFNEYPEREGLARRCLYWAFFKRFTARERMILLELYGKPWRIVEYHPDAKGDVADKDALDKAVEQADALGGSVSAGFGKGLHLRVESPDPKAGDLHNATIADCDLQMSKLVLGGTGTTDAQANRAESAIHENQQQLIHDADGNRISERFQCQLVDAIVVLNLGPGMLRYSPRFQLRTQRQKDRKAELERVKLVVDMGVAVAVDEIRETAGLRKPDEKEAVVQMADAAASGFGPPAPPRARVYDPTGIEPGASDPTSQVPSGPASPPGLPPAAPPTAPEAAPVASAGANIVEPDDDFDALWSPLGKLRAEVDELAPTCASDGCTNFPCIGENRRVSLKNSQHLVFPVSVARALRAEYPEIWRLGGTALAALQFRRLAPVVDRRGVVETDTEEEAVRLREAWARRYAAEVRTIGDVVACVKWLVVAGMGLERMLRVIADEKARLRERAAALGKGKGTQIPLPFDGAATQLAARQPKPFDTEYQGIPIRVDRPKGFVQTGVNHETGVAWERTYLFDYGFIPGTAGGDGEGLDVYLGPQSDSTEAHWILQRRADGGFDEYKLMLGFGSAGAAREAYVAHVPREFFGSLETTSVELVKALLGIEPAPEVLASAKASMLAAVGHRTLARQPSTVHGSPETIFERGVKAGASVTDDWAAALVAAAKKHDTASDIRKAIRAAANRLPVKQLGDELSERMLHTAMLGALDAAWEAEHDQALAPAKFAGGGQDNFTTKPFAEAIRSFLGKQVMPKARFERLSGAAKRKAFTVAGLARQEMLRTAFDELAKAIRDGDDLRTFSRALGERFDSAGWTRLNRSHTEVVFRNAVMGAYASGRRAQMTQPAVLKARPYWQVMGVKDDRSRPTHRAANGKVLRADDPFWKRAPLPWGHNCRCRLVSRSEKDIERLGLTVTSGSDLSGLPDDDWDVSSSLFGPAFGPPVTLGGDDQPREEDGKFGSTGGGDESGGDDAGGGEAGGTGGSGTGSSGGTPAPSTEPAGATPTTDPKLDIDAREAPPAEFRQAFEQAFPPGSPLEHFVSHYSEEELAGMKCLTAHGGKVGVAVKDHGDGRIEATALFNNGGPPGAGLQMLEHTVEKHGVNYVECYGPRLNTMYEKAGFRTVEKHPFDRSLAPKTWNEATFGLPDYHIMRIVKDEP